MEPALDYNPRALEFNPHLNLVNHVQTSGGSGPEFSVSGWLADHGFGFGFIGFQTLINFRVYRVFGFEK